MSLSVVSGGESLLRQRAVRVLLGDRTVQIVHTAEELEDALSPPMFGDLTPVWCRDLTLTEPMLKAIEQYDEMVVVELEGDPTAKSPLGKRREKIQSWNTIPSPKPWERRPAAVDFVRGEAMRLHLILSEPLGNTLVSVVGTDLGILAFELDKLFMLSKQQGQAEITLKAIAQTIGGFVETGVDELIFSVGQRKWKSILESLSLIEHTHGVSSSTVLRICAALMYHARIWLCCKTLCNGDPEPLGARLGLHPFVLKKQHFPHAVKWTEKELLALIAGISGVGRAVRRGCVHSHVQLQGVLLGLSPV